MCVCVWGGGVQLGYGRPTLALSSVLVVIVLMQKLQMSVLFSFINRFAIRMLLIHHIFSINTVKQCFINVM